METVPRVLFATTGSLGDLNPMLAIGERLLARRASVTFATHACYEDACRKNGFGFRPFGTSDYVHSLQYTRESLDERSFGASVEQTTFDDLERTYAQLLAAAGDADVLVAPLHVVAAHLVAERKNIPYIGCALCLTHIRAPAEPGSAEHKRLSETAARWHSRLRTFRQTQGLQRRVLPASSPLCDAASVLGVLPSFLLTPVHLRTPNLEVVGYATHRQSERMVQDEQLRSFCDERTVAFSFGSFADACDPDHFFTESVFACRALGLKCVYLSQHVTPAMRAAMAPDVMVRADVAPGAVFPLVGTVVHHGGTGTLVAACTHLKPMVIVPFFLDQPMHAARMRELIGAPQVPAQDYRRDSAILALRHARDQHESIRSRLGALMAHYQDGAEQGARVVLSKLLQAAARQGH